jgi:hypothetical protein
MSDPRDDRWEERADKAYSNWTYHPVKTAAKWFFGILALCLMLAAFGGILGLFLGWFSGTKNLATFEHSKEQVTAVLSDWTALQAAAQNVCDVEAAGSKDEEGDPLIIEDPALAYKATYRTIEQRYNRRMGNFFEAYVTRKIPIPGEFRGLPETAPTLKAAQDEWC